MSMWGTIAYVSKEVFSNKRFKKYIKNAHQRAVRYYVFRFSAVSFQFPYLFNPLYFKAV
jgi:hypothetical protein